MTDKFHDDELATTYELKVTSKIVRATGESLIGIEEEGETDLVVKLGMLEYAKDTLLHYPEDEEPND